jgi:glycosyltransferase involved in cell wall biosynthesis
MSVGKEKTLWNSIKVGYINGEASRINEKIVDGQWIGYLSEYIELVKIPPVALMKLFGGSIRQWHDHLPDSLDNFAAGLKGLCEKYGITVLYLNMPFMIPYILMARNRKNINLKVVFFGHSVASEFWLKLWIAVAPLIRPSDILLCPSQSCKTAMLNLSERYQYAYCIPHCIKLDKQRMIPKVKLGFNILSIGRIEDVKNIDFLIRCFADIKSKLDRAELIIAGEYIGKNQAQIQEYQRLITESIQNFQVGSSVKLLGPVFGEAKERCFQEADLLINLSTDPGETFGYNLIEAKMWGLPVICTRWDGFREVIEDFQDGVMIECRWDGQLPEINYGKAVDNCIQLLTDEPWREKLAFRALQNSAKFNYELIIPKIVEIIANSSTMPEDLNDNPSEFAMLPIRELPQIYHLEKLRFLDLQDETPLSILLKDYPDSLKEWMPKVKPVINHFV